MLMQMGGIAPFRNFKWTWWGNGLHEVCFITHFSLEKRLQGMGSQGNCNQDNKNKYKEKKTWLTKYNLETDWKWTIREKAELEIFESWLHFVTGWLGDINQKWYYGKQHIARRRDSKQSPPPHVKLDVHLGFHIDMIIRWVGVWVQSSEGRS